MDLITVILLLIAIWVFYKIYQAYTDIVSELKQIRMKCVREGLATSEGLTEHISDNYTKKTTKAVKDAMLASLKSALEKAY